MNRRKFIKLSAFTAASLTPIARIGTGLALGSTVASATAPSSGYKALVVLFFDGGNDAMNMFVPTETTPHGQYSTIRGSSDYEPDNIAVLATDLDDEGSLFTLDTNGHYIKNSGTNHPYYDAPQEDDGLETSAIRSYRKGSYHTTNANDNNSASGLGINSMMPELAAMYKQGKVSIVSNVGPLVKPTSQAVHGVNLDENGAELPQFLFAHNHQQRAVQTAQADRLGTTGWAGRVADAWEVNAPIGLNISYWGINRMLIGERTSPLKMPTTNPISFNTKHITANTTKGEPFENLLTRFSTIARENIFSTYYANQIKKAGDLSILLTTSMESAPDFSTFTAKNSYGENLFTPPDMESRFELAMHDDTREGIFQQLGACAKMIKVGRDTLGHNRQIFYVRMGGFDTHSHQTAGHGDDLRSLSVALSDFQKALKEMVIDDQVLTVSLSEFGRTLLNSGDGTGHGWGGHSFMMSGDSSFNGGNVFGTVMDDLRLDGANTYTAKGRIIPTTSIEQMLAPALKWFGVDDALMSTVLPNLGNFETSSGGVESAFLQGVFG